MARNKLSSAVKNLVLREKKKAPYLGVRELTVILADKHKINLSKSSIHNILKNKGVKSKPGRKPASLAYKARIVKPCGLMLLRAVDSEVGLFDCLTGQLKKYFPDLDQNLLKQLIILASFSFFVDKSLHSNLAKSGFLRLTCLRQLPLRTIDYFNQIITQKHPLVSLAKLKQDLAQVSAVKFYFKDGSQGFSDGRLATFWDKPPKLEEFSLSLRVVRGRLKRMFEQKLLIVGYTRSFNFLSSVVIEFNRGLNSGLLKVELLGPKREIFETLRPKNFEFSFIFGYSPQILNPTVSGRLRSRKFKPFLHQELGRFYFLNLPAVFSSSGSDFELKLDNIQIKPHLASSVSWGLLGSLTGDSSKTALSGYLTEYLYLWPDIQESFFKEVEAAEQRAALGLIKSNILKILPEKLIFTQPIDFVRVGQILSILFKELIGGWEPRKRSGTLSLRKGYIKIALKQVPVKVKKVFNLSCLYIDNRRVFLD